MGKATACWLHTVSEPSNRSNQIGTKLEPNGTSLCMEELGDSFFVFLSDCFWMLLDPCLGNLMFSDDLVGVL